MTSVGVPVGSPRRGTSGRRPRQGRARSGSSGLMLDGHGSAPPGPQRRQGGCRWRRRARPLAREPVDQRVAELTSSSTNRRHLHLGHWAAGHAVVRRGGRSRRRGPAQRPSPGRSAPRRTTGTGPRWRTRHRRASGSGDPSAVEDHPWLNIVHSALGSRPATACSTFTGSRSVVEPTGGRTGRSGCPP